MARREKDCVAAVGRGEEVPSGTGKRLGEDALSEVSCSQSVGEAGFDLTRTPSGEFHNKLSAFHDKFQLTLEHKFVFPEFGNGKNLPGRIFTGRETSPLCH